MKRVTWQIVLGSTLVILSAVLYAEQIRLFHAPRDTFFYLFQDLAFVPIQVLLVTLIVDQVLRVRERAVLLKKLNMVIGAFFSEAGTELLRRFMIFDRDARSLEGDLLVGVAWPERRFSDAIRSFRSREARMDAERGDLAGLQEFLAARRGFLLGLLENQNLLEHETFTELLWAVFHLLEELSARTDLQTLTHPDREHLAGDIRRAYVILVAEWLAYMRHLQLHYPYLFSLAVRTNPFDPNASAEARSAP